MVQYTVTGQGAFGGMSGVVYGLIGYMWMRGKYDPSCGLRLHPHTVITAMIWFFVCFVPGLVGPIANGAHAGGLSRSKGSTQPEVSLGVRGLASVTNAIYGCWTPMETTFSVPQMFDGRLFQIEATCIVLNVNNFDGRVAIDLSRTHLERFAN